MGEAVAWSLEPGAWSLEEGLHLPFLLQEYVQSRAQGMLVFLGLPSTSTVSPRSCLAGARAHSGVRADALPMQRCLELPPASPHAPPEPLGRPSSLPLSVGASWSLVSVPTLGTSHVLIMTRRDSVSSHNYVNKIETLHHDVKEGRGTSHCLAMTIL